MGHGFAMMPKKGERSQTDFLLVAKTKKVITMNKLSRKKRIFAAALICVFTLSAAMMFGTMALSSPQADTGKDGRSATVRTFAQEPENAVLEEIAPRAADFDLSQSGAVSVYENGFEVTGEVKSATAKIKDALAKKDAETHVRRKIAYAKKAISNLELPERLKLNEHGLPTSYSRRINGTATAYTGGGTTASGRPAKLGYVAVDPKVIPYGTELYIVSSDGKYVYGYCIAADTGGFVKGGWADVDLYMDTRSECMDFGIRGVEIYVL